jgi:hypothetical protein
MQVRNSSARHRLKGKRSHTLFELPTVGKSASSIASSPVITHFHILLWSLSFLLRQNLE